MRHLFLLSSLSISLLSVAALTFAQDDNAETSGIPDLSEFDRDALQTICEQLYRRIDALEKENSSLKSKVAELEKNAPPKTYTVSITGVVEVDTSDLHEQIKPIQKHYDEVAAKIRRLELSIDSEEGNIRRGASIHGAATLKQWKQQLRTMQVKNASRLRQIKSIEKQIKDAEETTTFTAKMMSMPIEIVAKRQYQKLAEDLEVGKTYEIEGTLAAAGRTTKTIIIRGIHSSTSKE